MKKLIAAIFCSLLVTACSSAKPNQQTSDVNSSLKSSTAEIVSLAVLPPSIQAFEQVLVGDVEIVDCTLSAGTKTKCYQFTVAPDATKDHALGPWCPTNITDSDASGGIWPEGGKINPVSGEFIANLSNFYNDDNWQLFNENTGEVNVTDSAVACAAAARPDVDVEYQNHCVECRLAYMDSVPKIIYTIPVDPVMASENQNINDQGVGVSFNGTKFEVAAPTQAILAANTIAPFDDCGGHINLHVGYHYHEHTGCSKEIEVENHEPIIGVALDGFAMHAQSPASNLDECGGHETENEGYHYHIAETGTNEFLSCYKGEFGCSNETGGDCDASVATDRRGGGGPPDRGGQGGDDRNENALPIPTPNGSDTAANIGTLAKSDYYSDYEIINDEFGTNVKVSISGDERIMFSNAIPPWPAEDFPVGNNSDVIEQDRTYNFPLNPVYIGNASRERSTGVSVRGIKFDAGTAQRASCENGVQYNVEAVQDLIPFGIDAHNAHVQNDGTYHYHNIPLSEIEGAELQHVGFALDGFLMYYSPTNQYPSSFQLRTEDREGLNCTYSEPDFPEITFGSTPDGTFQQDYEYIEGSGALDACNGAMINGEYAYFVTDAYPHIPRCLNGEIESAQSGGGGGPPAGGGGEPQQGGGPDFSEAAEKLGVSTQEIQAALGGPPPDFEAAAKTLGVTVEQLTEMLPAPR